MKVRWLNRNELKIEERGERMVLKRSGLCCVLGLCGDNE